VRAPSSVRGEKHPIGSKSLKAFESNEKLLNLNPQQIRGEIVAELINV